MAVPQTQIQRNYTVDKLTSLNYRTWAVKMEALLARSDFWGYIPAPAAAAPNYPAWKVNDTKAKSD